MKKIFLLSVLLTMMSCEQPSYIQGNSNQYTNSDVRYFRDTRTNLCFAEIGGGDSYAFTCVPCDSIKSLLK